MTTALEEGEGSASRPGRSLPPGKTRYPLYRRLRGPQGRSGQVKCTLVQALRLCTGRTAQRVGRGLALPFLDHGTRIGWGVRVTPRPLFTPRKDPVPTVQEAGWTPGPVLTGAENLAPTGIRSPDRPGRGQSLYGLSYTGSHLYTLFADIISI